MSDLPSSLPGIEVKSGITRVAGNQKLYLKLLRQVAAGAADTVAKLDDAFARGDMQAIRESAHSIKGASANLSAVALSQAAADLELAAKNEDAASVTGHLNALKEEYQRFVDVIGGVQDID